MKVKDEKEWMRQARSDLKNADSLLKTGRYIGCVFYCHLALEKSLKAVYYRKFSKEPPKTHHLMRLVDETALQTDLPDDMLRLIKGLSSASVPTRYPEDIRRMSKGYTRNGTTRTLERTREVYKWINEQLKK